VGLASHPRRKGSLPSKSSVRTSPSTANHSQVEPSNRGTPSSLLTQKTTWCTSPMRFERLSGFRRSTNRPVSRSGDDGCRFVLGFVGWVRVPGFEPRMGIPILRALWPPQCARKGSPVSLRAKPSLLWNCSYWGASALSDTGFRGGIRAPQRRVPVPGHPKSANFGPARLYHALL
jgi:hypothetical protein